MSARDCYDLGVELYNSKDFPESLLWLQEAHDRLDSDDNPMLEANIKTYEAMNHLEDGLNLNLYKMANISSNFLYFIR